MYITKDALVGFILGLIFIILIVVIVNKPQILEPQEPARQMPPIDIQCQSGHDELRMVDLQIEAVVIDMNRYLGWFPDEKEMIEEASAKALSDLTTVRQYLEKLNFPHELDLFKGYYLNITNHLLSIYKDIDSQDPNRIEELFNPVSTLYSECYAKLAEFIKSSDYIYKLPEGYDPIQEQLKHSNDPEDSKIYLDAVNLIKDRDYNKAFALLSPLQKKYQNMVFGYCINYWVSDCLINADTEGHGQIIFDLGDGITMLSDIIERGLYSPVLFDAFEHWRTQYQMFFGGMSNTSNIPNWDYNLLRWKAIKTTRTYLKINPEDPWAKSQLSKLLGEPNIGRGGIMGNDNLMNWSDWTTK